MTTPDSNTDPLEVAKFEALASRWWDPQGAFKPLHDINPLRLAFVDNGAGLTGGVVIDDNDMNLGRSGRESEVAKTFQQLPQSLRPAIGWNANRDSHRLAKGGVALTPGNAEPPRLSG